MMVKQRLDQVVHFLEERCAYKNPEDKKNCENSQGTNGWSILPFQKNKVSDGNPDAKVIGTVVQQEYVQPSLKSPQEYESEVSALTYSSDSEIIATGFWKDKTIQLRDSVNGEVIKTLQGHDSPVLALAYSPDAQALASGSGDSTIRLWDAASGESLHTLQGHSGPVLAVAYSPDGNVLASASEDKTIRLWDATTGNLLNTLRGHTDWVRAVSFSSDGKIIATGSEDKTVRLWDSSTGEPLKTLQGHSGGITSLTYIQNDKIIASGSSDHSIRLWDASTGESLKTLQGHNNTVNTLAYNADGKTLASGSEDKTVRLWDVNTGELLKTLEGHSGSVWAVAFNPVDTKILASGSDDKTVRLWDISSDSIQQGDKEVADTSYNPSSQTLANTQQSEPPVPQDTIEEEKPKRRTTGSTTISTYKEEDGDDKNAVGSTTISTYKEEDGGDGKSTVGSTTISTYREEDGDDKNAVGSTTISTYKEEDGGDGKSTVGSTTISTAPAEEEKDSDSVVTISTFKELKASINDPPSNIRGKPDGDILCTISQRGQVISVDERSISDEKGEQWFVTDACGQRGYIHQSQISVIPDAQKSSADHEADMSTNRDTDSKEKNNSNRAVTISTFKELKASINDPPSNIRGKPDGDILCTISQRGQVISVDERSISDEKGEQWFPTDACGQPGYIHQSQISIIRE